VISGAKLPEVSGRFRENSRFAEIFGRDQFDRDCRLRRQSNSAMIGFRANAYQSVTVSWRERVCALLAHPIRLCVVGTNMPPVSLTVINEK
jgi:hypothetical protein